GLAGGRLVNVQPAAAGGGAGVTADQVAQSQAHARKLTRAPLRTDRLGNGPAATAGSMLAVAAPVQAAAAELLAHHHVAAARAGFALAVEHLETEAGRR